MSRGWAGEALPKLGPEEVAAEESEAAALVLVVHGIGETFFANRNMSGMKTLKQGVDHMRALGATSSHGAAYYTQWAAGDDAAKEEARRAPGRVEFLPVEWNL